MKERSSVSVLRHPWTYLPGIIALFFCLFTISACSGMASAPSTPSETVHVYDNAHVLNTSEVQQAARQVPANVDVYTLNSFSGTQADFQRAIADKIGNHANLIVLGIDPQNNYQSIAKGSHVPLSTSDVTNASNAFSTNYGNRNYTRAIVAQLHSLGGAIQANGGGNPGGTGTRAGNSPLPWLIPLLILGAILFALAQTRRSRPNVQTMGRSTYRQPERTTRNATQNPPPFPTIDQSTYQRERGLRTRETSEQGGTKPATPDTGKKPPSAGERGTAGFGYELEKRPGETKPPTDGTSRPQGPDIPGQSDKKKPSGPEPSSQGPTGMKKPDASPGAFGRFGQTESTKKPLSTEPFDQPGTTPKPTETDTPKHFGQAGPSQKPPRPEPFDQPGTTPKPTETDIPKHFGQPGPAQKPPRPEPFDQPGTTPKPTETDIPKHFGQPGPAQKPTETGKPERSAQTGTTPKPTETAKPDIGKPERSAQAGTTPKLPETSKLETGKPERSAQAGTTPKPPETSKPEIGKTERSTQASTTPKPPETSKPEIGKTERSTQADASPKPPEASESERSTQADTASKPPEMSKPERSGQSGTAYTSPEISYLPGGIAYDPNKIVSEGRLGQIRTDTDKNKPSSKKRASQGDANAQPNDQKKSRNNSEHEH